MKSQMCQGIRLAVVALGLWAVPQISTAQEVIRSIPNPGGEFLFGRIVAAVGDTNGDGLDDVAVATSDGSQYRLRVWDSFSSTPLLTYLSPINESIAAIVGMDDLDGDGQADLAIEVRLTSAPTADLVNTKMIKYLSGVTGAEIRRNYVPETSGFYGLDRYLANIGDIDGDGISDLACTSPLNSTQGLTNNGSVFVFSGGSGDLL